MMSMAVTAGLLASALACVRVPEAEPLHFAVDRAELDDPSADRSLARAAAVLAEDPELHLNIVGHADEDNSDDYNRALSLRRAEHTRARLLALAPELPNLEGRLHVEARGEWDASDAGSDEQAKARNRRVELRFFYPRECPPSFDAEFLACEWARLPAPATAEAPPAEPAAPPSAEPPGPEPVRPRERQDFRGPYVLGLGGYAMSSGAYLRQHGRWGVGAGYLWGFDADFRVAAGLMFDHLIDAEFLFAAPSTCEPFCDRVDRSRLRLVPELRLGGSRGGVWGWLRLSAGVAWEHREAVLAQQTDVDGSRRTVQLAPPSWTPGGVFGIGPGVAVTLTGHLVLLFDATVTYAIARGTDGAGWSGAGIYDAGAGLGWIF
jgi:hypothetical protein